MDDLSDRLPALRQRTLCQSTKNNPTLPSKSKRKAQRTLQEKIVSSGLGGLLHHAIPVVGPAITELPTDLAIQRTNNRMYDMFQHFTNTIRDIGEEKVDREWVRSEEFQTLLFEALRQLHVTHDRQKIEMLGVALANSGAPGFKDDESKELFIRFVRELTQQHIRMLFERCRPQSRSIPCPSAYLSVRKWHASRSGNVDRGRDRGMMICWRSRC